MAVKNYRELIVWQKAVDLVEQVYESTKTYPRDEIYGLMSQIKRASVSVPSNIAEGQGRRTTEDFIRFPYMANGSLYEIETQTIVAHRLGFITEGKRDEILALSSEVGRILNGLINSLESRQ